jgi:hypothetical protein
MTPLNYLSDASFEVETKETQLLKVIVPMPKVTPIIGRSNWGQPLKSGSYMPLIY